MRTTHAKGLVTVIGGRLLSRIHDRTRTAADPFDEAAQMWDTLRADAISPADLHEIDAVFSRQTP